MILAYHRVSSNRALDAIMETGQIIPGIYRLDPDLIRKLCAQLLEYNPASPRGLGWPLSGFAFDAEYLVSRGARYRLRDLLSAYWSLIRKTLDDPEVASPTEAKRRILDGLLEIQDGG